MAVPVGSKGLASSDAYKTGYTHGCNDADFRYPGDRYINQPGKGPSQHSDEFMNGYEDGFNACNDNGYQSTTIFPELEEGKRYGTCEQKSGIGLVCDIEDDDREFVDLCAISDDANLRRVIPLQHNYLVGISEHVWIIVLCG